MDPRREDDKSLTKLYSNNAQSHTGLPDLSPAGTGPIYVEQYSMLQPEDVKDLKVPVFVEIKPFQQLLTPVDNNLKASELIPSFGSPKFETKCHEIPSTSSVPIMEGGTPMDVDQVLPGVGLSQELKSETRDDKALAMIIKVCHTKHEECLTSKKLSLLSPSPEIPAELLDTMAPLAEISTRSDTNPKPVKISEQEMPSTLDVEYHADNHSIGTPPIVFAEIPKGYKGPSEDDETPRTEGSALSLIEHAAKSGAMDISLDAPSPSAAPPDQEIPQIPTEANQNSPTLDERGKSISPTVREDLIMDTEEHLPVVSPTLSDKDLERTASTLQAPAVSSGKALIPRPAKRRRVLMEGVELPHSESVLHKLSTAAAKKESEKLESEKAMKHLKNPKVKKIQGTALNADTVRARLSSIGFDLVPIPLERAITDATFSRRFLSDHYGGNLRSTFPTISSKYFETHGLDDFMYMNLKHSPHAPQVPGAPGLWYTVGQYPYLIRADPRPKRMRVFAMLVSGIWQYQGQYALTPADSLTRQEWAAQDPKLRRTWERSIHEKDWGRATRARIALRARLGRAPTEAELNDALERKGKYKDVTPAHIREALLRGEEIMTVWTMKCVGYEADFQRGLIEKKLTWVPPDSSDSAKEGGEQKGQRVAKAASGMKTRKRAAEEMDDDLSTDFGVGDSTPQPVHTYGTRGAVRSR
ncbi:hypothetical protein D9615_008133 [Tricholomella constricta]|uniref:DUF6697 domain-containing protein n=1 Tax=Tricholomella constricta TaxID=117010 RepID=A0A8H5GVU8_9AGAR|nr:hypothetical protein D9615_008133 [Tricholomella constricta]